jgi:hypothetical protein
MLRGHWGLQHFFTTVQNFGTSTTRLGSTPFSLQYGTSTLTVDKIVSLLPFWANGQVGGAKHPQANQPGRRISNLKADYPLPSLATS